MDSLGKGKLGFTLLELMVVVAVIGIIITLAVPNFINARKRAQASSCVNNLKLLYESGQAYRLEEGSSVTTVDAALLYSVGYADGLFTCPTGGVYEEWNVDNKPTCSVGENGSDITWDDHIYR